MEAKGIKKYLGNDELKLFIFFVKLFFIWLSWKGIIGILGEEFQPSNEMPFPELSNWWKGFNLQTASLIMKASSEFLNLIGFVSFHEGRNAWIEGSEGVIMGNYCIGFQLIYYFLMLIVVSPFSIKLKLISLPLSILITFVINILRVSGLCLVVKFTPEYIFLAHDHLFNIVVFGTLISFYYYLNLISTKKEK
jgi:exosortase/archaeosortase family protein